MFKLRDCPFHSHSEIIYIRTVIYRNYRLQIITNDNRKRCRLIRISNSFNAKMPIFDKLLQLPWQANGEDFEN